MDFVEFANIYINADEDVRCQIAETLDSLRKLPVSPESEIHIDAIVHGPWIRDPVRGEYNPSRLHP